MRLANDALFQFLFESEDRLDLVKDHLADRDTGPVGDHVGHRLPIDDRMNKRGFPLKLGECGLLFRKLLFATLLRFLVPTVRRPLTPAPLPRSGGEGLG